MHSHSGHRRVTPHPYGRLLSLSCLPLCPCLWLIRQAKTSLTPIAIHVCTLSIESKRVLQHPSHQDPRIPGHDFSNEVVLGVTILLTEVTGRHVIHQKPRSLERCEELALPAPTQLVREEGDRVGSTHHPQRLNQRTVRFTEVHHVRAHHHLRSPIVPIRRPRSLLSHSRGRGTLYDWSPCRLFFQSRLLWGIPSRGRGALPDVPPC